MHPRRATTLVEAIACVVILAVAVPPMLLALRAGSLRRVAPIQAGIARWLIQERLEDIIADRHSTARGFPFLIPANYPDEPAIPGFPGFSRATSIADTGPDLASAGTGYKRLTVTVTWTDPTGQARTLQATTAVADD
jgi:hypothetical protein